MSILPLLAAAIFGALVRADAHQERNPVFKNLVQEGIAAGAMQSKSVTLPEPSMADGLDAAAQAEVIETVAGGSYSLATLTRKSVVAPHVFRMREAGKIGDRRFRGADFWFVAYGDLSAISNKEFLNRLLGSGSDDGKAEGLSDSQLAERGLQVSAANRDREGFGHVDYELINRVQLEFTGHSFYSQTDDSLLVAARIAPSFTEDKQFPNQWQAIMRKGTQTSLGPPHPYDAAGLYMKITRLVEPAGALFVECHLVYEEPHGWFNGTNLLGAKLPAVVQNQVRAARRELHRASKAE